MGKPRKIDRLAIFKRTQEKKNHVIISTTTLDDGVDIPNLGAIVFPVPFSKKLTCIQRAGRVARKAPGKTCAIIIDVNDTKIKKAQYAYYRRKAAVVNTFNVIRTSKLQGDFSALLTKILKEK